MAQVIDMEHKEGEAVRSRFKSVCVFCGSSKGKKECYETAAIELGQELVSRKLKLVYGGGCIGLMGCVAQAVQDGGGKVLGIIPRRVLSAEITGETVGREMCVTNMHQRKAEMSRHSNCFIALPGGFGTFDELLEVVSWAQLGIHDKPVGVLNVDGFFNALLAYIDNAVAEGFIDPCQRHIIVVATDAKELLQKLEDYVPVHESALSKESWEGEEQHQKEIPDVGFNIAPAPPVATAKQNEMALEKREKKRRTG